MGSGFAAPTSAATINGAGGVARDGNGAGVIGGELACARFCWLPLRYRRPMPVQSPPGRRRC
jgi:hypothetical protein